MHNPCQYVHTKPILNAHTINAPMPQNTKPDNAKPNIMISIINNITNVPPVAVPIKFPIFLKIPNSSFNYKV